MKKREFLEILQRELYKLPHNELKEQLNFYSEMIDDGIEEGLTEDEAVSKIGSVSEILSQINKPTQARKNTEYKKEGGKAPIIVLLILGSPIWIALLSVAFVLFVCAYVVIWSLWISFISVEIALAAGGVYALVAPIAFTVNGQWKLGIGVLGAGLISAGFSMLLWTPCKKSVIFACKLSKAVFLFTRKLLFKRRRFV